MSAGEEEQEQPARTGFGCSGAMMGVAAVLGVVALIALAVIEARGVARGGGLLQRGDEAPAFELDRLGGGELDSDAYRGRVLMLDFWATWCPPCVEELPILVKLAKEYEGRGLAFVAVAKEDSPATEKVDVALFVDRRLPSLKPYVVFATSEVGQAYRVEALPTLYFIDREGNVIAGNRGALSERQLRKQIKAALGEKGSGGN